MEETVTDELIEAGRGYERLFVPALFEVWTKHLVAGAEVQAGSQVLDIACGTGVLARRALAAAGPTGRVVGADPAPGMLAAAREREPGIEWIRCGAESLSVPAQSFDCAISQFGMMFFQNRERAASEMHRVLKPGGRLAIATWRSVEHNPAYQDIIAVLQEQVGTAAADALRLPFSLGDADAIVALLEASGFSEVSVQARTETARFPGSRQLVEAELRGWLPLFDIFIEEVEIQRILVESDRVLGKYVESSGQAVFPTSAHIVSARKR